MRLLANRLLMVCAGHEKVKSVYGVDPTLLPLDIVKQFKNEYGRRMDRNMDAGYSHELASGRPL